MRVGVFTCDMCGEVMHVHQKRSTVTISDVPAFRGTDRKVFDLCPACAERLRIELSRGEVRS